MQEMRRVILDAAEPGDKGDHMSIMGIAAPSTGSDAQKPSDDEQMEYQRMSIDSLVKAPAMEELLTSPSVLAATRAVLPLRGGADLTLGHHCTRHLQCFH